MKKKLLITLFIALVVCLFAFSVNAANEVTLVGGETVDFATVFKVDSKNQVTGFNSGYGKNDITDVIFPDEIIGLESNFLFGSATNLNSLTFAATDTFFISGDGIFSNCSVKTITFDPNCIVEIRKGNFSGCKSLTQITFPKFKVLAGSSFASCSNMVATNELILAEGMTEIGGHAFNGCTSLKGTVYFPSTLEKIQEYSFQNTGFEYFDLSKCASLTAVGGGYGGPFTDNHSITTLDLSGCTSLKSLKNSFAQNCSNLTKVILPPNLESIPHKAFAHCYKLQSIVFPASLTYVADEAFHSARRDQDIKTFTVYIQSNVQFHATYPFRDSGAKIEFVLIGDGVTVESFLAANTYSAITNATIVDYLDAANPGAYVPGGDITSHTIVANYCKDLAIDGEHAYSGNPCVVICASCKLATMKENPEHNTKVSVVYENGYDNIGFKLTLCMNEGCTHKEAVEMEALFACLGYSAPEFGANSFTVGYTVNNGALLEYETLTGKTVRYGVFAATKQSLDKNDVFGKDGKATAGVIAAEIFNHEFSFFELKLSGFNAAQMDVELAFGAYVMISDEETVEYSYMQDGSPNENDKYYFTSYNEIVGTPKAE